MYPVTEIVKITDGDTYWLRVDVGFRQSMLVHTRLNEWDTPEIYRGSSYERERGKVARDFAEHWMRSSFDDLHIQTYKDPDSFGRWLADVFIPSGASLGKVLGELDLATQWPTRWRDVYDNE